MHKLYIKDKDLINENLQIFQAGNYGYQLHTFDHLFNLYCTR
jgi:hypothetical protein